MFKGVWERYQLQTLKNPHAFFLILKQKFDTLSTKLPILCVHLYN